MENRAALDTVIHFFLDLNVTVEDSDCLTL